MALRLRRLSVQPTGNADEGRLLELTITLDLEQIAEPLAELLGKRLAAEPLGPASPWLDVDAAASYLSCSRERVRKLIQRREIPFHQERPGGRVFLHRRELDEWLLAL